MDEQTRIDLEALAADLERSRLRFEQAEAAFRVARDDYEGLCRLWNSLNRYRVNGTVPA